MEVKVLLAVQESGGAGYGSRAILWLLVSVRSCLPANARVHVR